MRRTVISHRSDRRGFTLLEILIVLAIVGVIAAMAVPRLVGQQRAASKRITEQAIANLEQAIELYAVSHNGEPPAGGQQALQMLMQRDEVMPEPVLDKVPVDGWGEPLFYQYPNPHADTSRPAIWSSGPDRQNQNGSGDDVNNWANLVTQ